MIQNLNTKISRISLLSFKNSYFIATKVNLKY
jgi:hypothetical protein